MVLRFRRAGRADGGRFARRWLPGIGNQVLKSEIASRSFNIRCQSPLGMCHWLRHVVLGVVLLLATVSGAVSQEKRVALVVGVSAYKHANTLPNTLNDAKDIAAALSRLGFDVEIVKDPDRARLEAGVRRFGDRARGADVALFYYAGHALEYGGQNWLVPVQADLHTERDLRFETLEVDAVMDQIVSQARISLVILDSCRDNPFRHALTGTFREMLVGRGLAAPQTGASGTLVVYATAPGRVADDGAGPHSPFTAALLRHIEEPGVEIRRLITMVRQDVRQATGGRQTPWDSSSLEGQFFLRPVAADIEVIYWDSVRSSNDPADLQSYLSRYPSGVFADLARNRIARLRLEGSGAAAQDQKAAAEAQRAADQKAAAEAKKIADLKAAVEAKRLAEEKAAAEAAQRLADQQAAADAKRLAEQKAAAEAKRLADEKAAAEVAQRLADAKAAMEAKRLAEQQAAAEAKRVADAKAAMEAKRLADQQAAMEAKRVADEKAAMEAKRLADQQAAAEAKRVADEKAAMEAKRLADQQAAAEAKRVADEKAAMEAKRLADQQAAAEAKRVAEEKAAAEAAQRLADRKAAAEARRLVREKAAAEAAQRLADQKAAREAKRLADEKAAVEAKRLADEKAAAAAAEKLAEQKAAAEAAQRLADEKAAVEAKRLADLKAAAEAKRLAEEKAAAEAVQRLAEQKAAMEAKQLADRRAAEEAKRLAAEKAAADAARKLAEQKAGLEAAQRLAEEKTAAEAQRLAEQKAAQRLAQAKAEDDRQVAEQKIAMGTPRKETDPTTNGDAHAPADQGQADQGQADQVAAAEAARRYAEQRAAAEAALRGAAQREAADTARKVAERKLADQKATADAARKLAEQRAADAKEQKLVAQKADQDAARQRLADQRAAADAARQGPRASDEQKVAVLTPSVGATRRLEDTSRETGRPAQDADHPQVAMIPPKLDQNSEKRISAGTIFGTWCAGPVRMSISANRWEFRMPNGSEVDYPIEQYTIEGDHIVIQSSIGSKKVITEFSGITPNGIVQLRGKDSGSNWVDYNRAFARCR